MVREGREWGRERGGGSGRFASLRPFRPSGRTGKSPQLRALFLVLCILAAAASIGLPQDDTGTVDMGAGQERPAVTGKTESSGAGAQEGDESQGEQPPKIVNTFVHAAAIVIEVAGVLIIGLAAIISSIYFLWSKFKKHDENPYHEFRLNLGRGILLGLEFLVAADIVGTVAVDPTFQNLGVLGLIVAIRTFLSFSLEVEIHGRWPWQGSTVVSKRDK